MNTSQEDATPRRLVLMALGATALGASGCMTKPLRPVNADGTYCHSIGKSFRPTRTCTPTAVPSDFVEAEAKRFDADPAALTLYILRRRWGDALLVVPVTVDSLASAATIPESLVRVRLAPGAHKVSTKWTGQTIEIAIEGRAGDLRAVELIGSEWPWGASFRWASAQIAEIKTRAQVSKLVADLDLRR